MMIFSGKHGENKKEGGIHVMREEKRQDRHMPPHERKALIHLEFEE